MLSIILCGVIAIYRIVVDAKNRDIAPARIYHSEMQDIPNGHDVSFTSARGSFETTSSTLVGDRGLGTFSSLEIVEKQTKIDL
jgi:hypothetical protein